VKLDEAANRFKKFDLLLVIHFRVSRLVETVIANPLASVNCFLYK